MNSFNKDDNNYFSILSKIIHQRRSVKPGLMNGGQIPDEQVNELLHLADWAPTHGNTEPWRFIVYAHDSAKEFSRQHAELYKNNTLPEKFLTDKYEKLISNGDKASHIIVAIMQRGNLSKVPVIEEIAATAAAVQHILLGATALGIASMWSTGGMTHHKAMKDFFQLREEDIVMGIIYLGYSEKELSGRRATPMTEKIKWM